jgi:hypothetical protein
VQGNRSPRIVELLHGLNELISMLSIRRIEVRSAGMTQIALSDQIREDDQLMARPPSFPQTSQRTGRGNLVPYPQMAQRTPAVQGE